MPMFACKKPGGVYKQFIEFLLQSIISSIGILPICLVLRHLGILNKFVLAPKC